MVLLDLGFVLGLAVGMFLAWIIKIIVEAIAGHAQRSAQTVKTARKVKHGPAIHK